MKVLEEIKEIIRQNRTVLEQKFKVKEIALFGSYVRGEQNNKSDLDIMVKFREPVGFLFIHLADYLEDLLKIKIDLVTEDSIRPNRLSYIRKDLTYV